MSTIERYPDILTPDQAAAYLQIDRDTVYRYIRAGRINASRLGRSYRIPRRSLELLLDATHVRSDVQLRDYSDDEVKELLAADELSDRAREVVAAFTAANLPRPNGFYQPDMPPACQ